MASEALPQEQMLLWSADGEGGRQVVAGTKSEGKGWHFRCPVVAFVVENSEADGKWRGGFSGQAGERHEISCDFLGQWMARVWMEKAWNARWEAVGRCLFCCLLTGRGWNVGDDAAAAQKLRNTATFTKLEIQRHTQLRFTLLSARMTTTSNA